MYKAYLVTYSLKQPLARYTPLFQAIQRAPKWWHYLENTWIIATSDDVAALQKTIVPLVFHGDFILIIEVRRSSGGWMPQEAWNWINENAPL